MTATAIAVIIGMAGLASQVSAQPPVAVTAPDDPNARTTIVVTAPRDPDAALAECLARRCPPIKDMNASIAAAEGRFREGDYRGARHIMEKAVDRNKGFAARYPRGVATLYDVHARVAYHYGDPQDFRRSIYGRAEVLANGLPATDADRLRSASDVGDMLATIGEYDEADRRYAAAIRAAREAGQPQVAAAATLRRAWLQHLRGNSARALRELASVVASPDGARFGLAATIMRARMSRDLGDPKVIAALIGEISRQSASKQPVLLYEPPLAASAVTSAAANANRFRDTVSFNARSSDSGILMWADVGFWIRDDGRVEDVEVLRSSRSTEWIKPIIGSIANRRYAPGSKQSGGPGHYRLERYTYTADFRTPIGSFVKRRAGEATFRRQDVTPRAPS